MSLEERIRKDMQGALKEKNKIKLETLRSLIAQIKDERIKLMRDMTEEDVITVLNRAVKRRNESIELFRQGNRFELAEQEETEAEIIKTYLPEPLSESEIEQIVIRIIKDVGAESEKDIGKVMGPVMKEMKGKADGKLVQNVVRKTLSSKA
jgi:hypothetical protein